MHLRLNRKTITALYHDAKKGRPVLKLLRVEHTPDQLRFTTWVQVDLAPFPMEQLREIREGLASVIAVHGVKGVVYDLDRWIAALGKGTHELKELKARTIRQFESLLIHTLLLVPGPRLYRHRSGKAWDAFFVTEVEWHAKREDSRGGVTPEHVTMDVAYRRHNETKTFTVSFWADDCLKRTATEALGAQGYLTETPELREDYEDAHARYLELHGKVGRQMLAHGVGDYDRDDVALNDDAHNHWRRYRDSESPPLDHEGQPGRVVIDAVSEKNVDAEESEDARSAGTYFNTWFWTRQRKPKAAVTRPEYQGKRGTTVILDHDEDEAEEDEDDREEMEGELTVEEFEGKKRQVTLADVPTHPDVTVFSFDQHRRLSIHVTQLADYVYDADLGDKLVLPDETRELVGLLLAHKGVFQDIVRGKGGGAVVLCAGPPGVGKTLTAEVYAEVAQRPLYSVQCSQLGINPTELEKQLLVAFKRAQRWNAIMLLDEADVYVAARGTDLKQNAIVGVFLRVLEYYRGVLFMTTNRADLVDDAIASRCLARIDYTVPTPAQQFRIWEVLAQTMSVQAPKAELHKITKEFPRLSGRDVKNLMKLALLIGTGRNKAAITLDAIKFVKRFKPTMDVPE